jgi:hypothetical protein
MKSKIALFNFNQPVAPASLAHRPFVTLWPLICLLFPSMFAKGLNSKGGERQFRVRLQFFVWVVFVLPFLTCV